MPGREHAFRERRCHDPSALLGEPEAGTEQGRRRGRAEGDDDLGTHDAQLCCEPRRAGIDLDASRLGVDAALTALDEAEVFDRVGQVDRLGRDARARERVAQQLARGPDERLPGAILAVAGLLADEHQSGASGTFAEHGLRRALEEVAAATAFCGGAQPRERTRRRHERRGRRGRLSGARRGQRSRARCGRSRARRPRGPRRP